MTKLTERRAADREKMARMLADAMIAAGATAQIDREWGGPREVMVRITAPGGAYINVDFDGDSSQPDVHVATWNTPEAVFLNMPGMNPHHFSKCNRVARGIENLIATLSSDVERLASGAGYLDHDSPQILAMVERYAANGWHDPRVPRDWAGMRAEWEASKAAA